MALPVQPASLVVDGPFCANPSVSLRELESAGALVVAAGAFVWWKAAPGLGPAFFLAVGLASIMVFTSLAYLLTCARDVATGLVALSSPETEIQTRGVKLQGYWVAAVMAFVIGTAFQYISLVFPPQGR